MTYAKKTDRNQSDIVQALRQIGASVTSLARVGNGVPDLLIGYRGINILLEIKTIKGKCNARQEDWHASWRGSVAVVQSVDEAIAAVAEVAS